MIVLAIALIATAVLTAVAVRANTRFRRHDRLPMQWWIDGSVNWSAPRVIALAFVPALGAGMMACMTLLDLTVRPRAGQEAMVVPVAVLLGATFVAAQLLHIWMIDRTLDRDRG